MFGLFSSAEDDTRATKPPTADQESSLLSGVASWFGYGASSEAVGSQVKEEVAFDTADAEQDWVLVDKRDPSPAVCPQRNENLGDVEDSSDEKAESDEENRNLFEADLAATATSTYQLEHEHDWVMTPRPCFTQRSNVRPVEYHLSEDLLIEHASMSVYDKLEMVETDFLDIFSRKKCSCDCMDNPDWKPDWWSPPNNDDDEEFKHAIMISTRGSEDSSSRATQPTERCQHRLETKLELMARVKAVKSSQRKQQEKEKQGLNRKHLQRQNKNILMQSQGKRANRNNRARNTSGAMKSRIPQRRH